MMTLTTDAEQEETLESEAFRDALLNGDEKINRLVKLVDNRFESAARRANKRAKESRERDESLRNDLSPLMELADAFVIVKRILPIIGAIGSGIVFVGGTLYALGVIPF